MPFELQGHRGARGAKPENTLPSFEAALDAGVTSIETDVQMTRDGVLVLFHDFAVSEKVCHRVGADAPDPADRPALADLSFVQLRQYAADRNPDPKRFPDQDYVVTPMAGSWPLDPWAIPTLADLFQFVAAYAAAPGKTAAQRQGAAQLIFDLEVKRRPFRSADDGIESKLVEAIQAAGGLGRTRVRSFDHRTVRKVVDREPRIEGAILVAGTAPIDPAELTRQAGARVYCPDFEFLDLAQVRQLHAAGLRVIPWTVNQPEDWRRLLDWGVDGITTDFPERRLRLA